MSVARVTALVFSGGLGLATYHAGVFEEFQNRRMPLDWVAGSSAGAVTAALIAGNRPENVLQRLRAFWNMPASGVQPVYDHPFNHLNAWLSVAGSHLFGSSGHFRPRLPSPVGHPSLYDLDSMRRRLLELIDFEYLNRGAIRLSVAATDVETGDPAIFDSVDGPIHIDHLMASCGFLPEFAPVAIDGRVYVDGGLSLNAPFDPVLQTEASLRLFVIDLFGRDGLPPMSLEAAAERKIDLTFSNQTYLRLKPMLELRALKITDKRKPDDVFYLSYRSGPAEPGPEKSFNFSYDGLARRWREGALDMVHALDVCSKVKATDGVRVVRRPSAGRIMRQTSSIAYS
jgi:NTE family protein